MEYTTTVINLINGPGSGKSTIAAELYALMKRKRMNVEMVREVAKEWAWEGRKIGPYEQISILGEQIKKESVLFGKVKYVVTDSPVLLGAFYFEYNHRQFFLNDMVTEYYKFCEKNGIRILNFVIPRKEKYDPNGRFESEDDAILIDEEIKHYLDANCYNYHSYTEHHSDILNAIIQECI